MTISIETFCNGDWWQNCYLVNNDATNEALIVDPGSDAQAIINILDKKRLQPVAIINTHAHYDHVGAVTSLMEHYAIPFYLHSDDLRVLRQANMYKMIFGAKESIRIPEISHDLKKCATVFDIAGFSVEWFATPGHTAGGVCFKIDDNLFTGDTILPSGVGRTDLPGGDAGMLSLSVEKLAHLDGAIRVWAGHGPMIILGEAMGAARRSLEK